MLPNMEQADDFIKECDALYEIIRHLNEKDLSRVTLFKSWTIEDILRHLFVWDTAARLTLEDSAAFVHFFAPVPDYMAESRLRDFERSVNPGQGLELVTQWRENSEETARLYALANPKQRLKWGGPELSARSCITSRLMETWAHGQAIYDELGIKRQDGNWIRNIVQIGVQTYGWTFQNRGMELPGSIPTLHLAAPDGSFWLWNNPEAGEHITGSATEFCQVVTQTRNIADTSLAVSGPIGKKWMAIAQCFAGPPSDPPMPGERHIAFPSAI